MPIDNYILAAMVCRALAVLLVLSLPLAALYNFAVRWTDAPKASDEADAVALQDRGGHALRAPVPSGAGVNFNPVRS